MSLKEKFYGFEPCKIVGAYDAITSKLIENAGFDAIWASGLCISAAYGVTDTNIVSMDQLLNNVKNMTRTSKLPIVVDCDTGFGDYHSVIHLVKELQNVGAEGMCIEDKVFPKVNSFWNQDAKVLAKPEEFATKIRAAAENKKSENFAIIARTEALIAGAGMDEALYRAELYRLAGADAIVIHSKKGSPDEVLEFARKWNNKLPLIVIPTKYPSLSMTEIKNHNIAGVVFANQPLRAAIYAMQKYLNELAKAERLIDCEQPMASVEEIFKIQGMDRYMLEEELYHDFEGKILETFENSNKEESA